MTMPTHTGPLVAETRGGPGAPLGVVLGATSAAAVGYAMARLATRVPFECVADGCMSEGLLIPMVIVGSLLAFVSFVMTPWAWVVNPIAGLVAGGVTVHQRGLDVLGEHLWFALFIGACVMIGPLLLLLLSGTAAKSAKAAANLVATGNRAVAHVMAAHQTGIYVNERPSVRVEYTVQPLDGTPAFSYQQSRVLDITDVVPRLGLAWPAWYLPGDQSTVAVGAPSGAAVDHAAIQLLAEFGLAPVHAYGYDPLQGATLA